jgi:hypothetical protein
MTTGDAAERRSWSVATEHYSMAHPQRLMDDAIAAYAAIDDAGVQLQLADEIAVTRGPELTLAYRNVVMVAAGYRTCRDPVAPAVDGERVVRQPCVLFIVRRKWKKSARVRDVLQRLPPRLLAFVDWQGRRLLCAVPTDVQVQSGFEGATVMGNRALHVDDSLPEYGTPTCAVEVGSGAGARRFLVCARHVLDPQPDLDASAPGAGIDVAALDGRTLSTAGPPFGLTSGFGGELRADGEPSFDVQFVDAVDWLAVRPLLAALVLSDQMPITEGPAMLAELPTPFEILVPQNHPDWVHAGLVRPALRAGFRSVMPSSFGFDHTVTLGGEVQSVRLNFWRLIRLEVLGDEDTVRHGDSGSAVVARHADGSCTLVGMFIAASQGFAYAIAAWQLFDSRYYWTLPLPHPVRLAPVMP